MGHATEWSNSVRRQRGHAEAMATGCLPWAAELVHSESNRFLDQPSPQNDAEAQVRRDQMHVLNMVVRGIVHGSDMASSHPHVESQIEESVRRTCDQPLPTTEADRQAFSERAYSLMSEIRIQIAR